MSGSGSFEIGGLNLWVLVSGNGLNLILEGLVLLGASAAGPDRALSQVVLVLGTFLSTLLVSFICGRMEREQYLKYACYTLPGNLVLTLPSVLLAGILGVMLVAVAAMGAFNGARLAEMTVPRHSRE